MKTDSFTLLLAALVSATLLLGGCGKETTETDGLTKIVLQTDWYAQPEHGGFYQAQAKGFYEEEGLNVTILPGGPNSMTTEKVAQGRASFAIGRSDDVIIHTSRGVPLLIAGALMQKDPQAIMFHQNTGIESFKDLDGKVVMAAPGSAYIDILERKFDIEIQITPLDYGMARFIADESFIQQCFITNEPYYVRRQGVNPGTLLIADAGFDPYRVWYTTQEFAEKNPEVVAAFTRASIRGWEDYLYGDPTPANAVIAERNPQMDEAFMHYSRTAMIENDLVNGDASEGEGIGKVTRERISRQIEQLLDIGMIDRRVDVEALLRPELLPEQFPREPQPPVVLDTRVQRQSPDDLEVFIPGSKNPEAGSHFLPFKELEKLPQVELKKKLDVGEGIQVARGVYLKTLVDSLKPSSGTPLLVLANCSDLYQSNFSPEVMVQNLPILITHVGDESVAAWASAQGRPDWGPYLIEVQNEENLVHPAHKKPWGVQQIVLAPEQALLADLRSGGLAEKHLSIGVDIFLQSCASCHNTGNSPLGGTVSNRSLPVLATHAKYNKDYFLKMLEDPVGTNPTAEKMPILEGWDNDQIEALRIWMASHAN